MLARFAFGKVVVIQDATLRTLPHFALHFRLRGQHHGPPSCLRFAFLFSAGRSNRGFFLAKFMQTVTGALVLGQRNRRAG